MFSVFKLQAFRAGGYTPEHPKITLREEEL
jgi:hypothetical protein